MCACRPTLAWLVQCTRHRAPLAQSDDYYYDADGKAAKGNKLGGSYDPSAALQSAWLSSAAYCSSNHLSTWSCGQPCESVGISGGSAAVTYDSALNLQAYVVQLSSGVPAVVFRGTEPSSLKNWILNLNISHPAPYDGCAGCSVEGGFYHGYQELMPNIRSSLSQMGFGPGDQVLVTGHSLGASMATVAAYELAGAGWDVLPMYTFGQPRTGNDAFHSSFDGRVEQWRVTHHHDPVPHLPPEDFGYHHTATEVWYNEANTQYQVCDGSGEDPNCADSVPWYDLLDVEDHLHYMGIMIDGATCT